MSAKLKAAVLAGNVKLIRKLAANGARLDVEPPLVLSAVLAGRPD